MHKNKQVSLELLPLSLRYIVKYGNQTKKQAYNTKNIAMYFIRTRLKRIDFNAILVFTKVYACLKRKRINNKSGLRIIALLRTGWFETLFVC